VVLRRLTQSRFVRQLGWSFSSRLVAAALQLVVVVLLARGLPVVEFAKIASANAVMLTVVALNGFGLLRQTQYRRSVDPDDPDLPAIFAVWQRFTTSSAVLWLAGCGALWAVTDDVLFAQLAPISAWLVFEQQTTLWNAISIVDGRAHETMSSYLWRRIPVVVALAVAPALDLDTAWTWSISLAVGSALAYVAGVRRAVPWSRRLLPGRRPPGTVTFDFSYWWSEVGSQVRDLDVLAITLVSAATGGAYALPARLVRPMNIITMATTSVAFPRIARMRVVSQRQLVLGSLIATAPVAVVAGAVALLAGQLPRLVGDEYEDAIPVLRILCLLAAVVGLGALLVTFLQARSREANRFTGRFLIGLAAVQVLAAALATYVGDAETAAWTVLAVSTAGVFVIYLRAVRECGVERSVATTSDDEVPSPL
jgi:O-antigen/teichoic acid export membrane protein